MYKHLTSQVKIVRECRLFCNLCRELRWIMVILNSRFIPTCSVVMVLDPFWATSVEKVNFGGLIYFSPKCLLSRLLPSPPKSSTHHRSTPSPSPKEAAWQLTSMVGCRRLGLLRSRPCSIQFCPAASPCPVKSTASTTSHGGSGSSLLHPLASPLCYSFGSGHPRRWSLRIHRAPVSLVGCLAAP